LILERAWRSASVLCLVVMGHGAAPALPAGMCAGSVNYCAELIPTTAYPGASAVLELSPVPSPFDVAVTRDGRARYEVIISIAGLPRPAHDDPGSPVYVAWMTTMDLDSVVKLGQVKGGQTVLGETTRDQFRILISAERSASSRTRAGPLVFRGTSPGSRLLAHRDAVSPFLAATMMSPMPAMAMAMGAAGSMAPDMPPFLPSASDGTSPPPARPREVVHLHSGDTLALTAMMVRRTVAGRSFTAYAYNGQIPGPLIDVAQGTHAVVQFHNATDLPSAIHWHGLRLDSASDGAVGITQDAVAPGGTFTYQVRFPDAGLFWYHSHEREDIQQPLGLYGNIVVRPRSASASRVNAERILTVGDILLADSAPVPFGAAGPTHVLMGRFGNVMLANGAAEYRDTVRRGAVVRYYLTNVSNARVLNLAFGDGRVKVISAGAGPFVQESWANSVVIAPAERYVVDVRFPDTGIVAVTNRIQALDHLTGAIRPETDTVALTRVEPAHASPDHASDFGVLRRDDAMRAEIASYRRQLGRPADRILKLEMHVVHLPPSMSAMLGGPSVPVEWNDGMGAMNAMATSNDVVWVLRDSATGKENMDIAWRFQQGDVVKVRIYNDPVGPHAMDHPIHLHGQRMLVLARNGVPNPYLAWKDTALIPAGQVTDLLFDLSNPGRWMLHCHIAEHRGAQMMMVLSVQPRRRSREIRAAS
jgi:suppressor of ftsI